MFNLKGTRDVPLQFNHPPRNTMPILEGGQMYDKIRGPLGAKRESSGIATRIKPTKMCDVG